MAIGLQDQIERNIDHEIASKRGIVQHSHKWDKTMKNRRERKRANQDPECTIEYKRFKGWEW